LKALLSQVIWPSEMTAKPNFLMQTHKSVLIGAFPIFVFLHQIAARRVAKLICCVYWEEMCVLCPSAGQRTLSEHTAETNDLPLAVIS